MALPGLVAARNLADVADRERAWDNLGLNIGVTLTPLTGLDSDATAYIDRVMQADQSQLEAEIQFAINNFVVGCKSDGIWPAIKASCILAGARTLNGALVPLVGTAPTNFNFVSGDYNRKTGLVGDGSTKYLATNYTYPADLQNNCHAAVWESGSSAIGVYFGAVDNVNSGNFIAAANKASRHYNSSAFTFIPTTFGTTGFQGIARSSALSYRYRSAVGGTQTATISSATLTLPSFDIFRRNKPTTPDGFCPARLAFYSIGESLDLALLDARVTTLISAISTAIP
jgi:hypothetical protein